MRGGEQAKGDRGQGAAPAAGTDGRGLRHSGGTGRWMGGVRADVSSRAARGGAEGGIPVASASRTYSGCRESTCTRALPAGAANGPGGGTVRGGRSGSGWGEARVPAPLRRPGHRGGALGRSPSLRRRRSCSRTPGSPPPGRRWRRGPGGPREWERQGLGMIGRKGTRPSGRAAGPGAMFPPRSVHSVGAACRGRGCTRRRGGSGSWPGSGMGRQRRQGSTS
jgi:hypothetical protein